MPQDVSRGYAKGRARRQEILDRAVDLFGESGYRGASLRDIAARAGISHPGLLHHFPTKEALLQAVLAQRDEATQQRLAAAGSRGVGTLSSLVDLVVRNSTQRGIVELFAVLSAEATAADHPAHDYFAERYRSSVAAAQQAYQEARADGHLRPEIDPELAARQLIAAMDGMQVQWLLADATIDLAAPIRALVAGQLTVPLDDSRGDAPAFRTGTKSC